MDGAVKDDRHAANIYSFNTAYASSLGSVRRLSAVTVPSLRFSSHVRDSTMRNLPDRPIVRGMHIQSTHLTHQHPHFPFRLLPTSCSLPLGLMIHTHHIALLHNPMFLRQLRLCEGLRHVFISISNPTMWRGGGKRVCERFHRIDPRSSFPSTYSSTVTSYHQRRSCLLGRGLREAL